jgi:hypothetical protein
MNRRPKLRRAKTSSVDLTPVVTAADRLMAALGWKPSLRVFHTSANRECGSCHLIKPGSEFDVPVTPGRPDLNLCRECSAWYPSLGVVPRCAPLQEAGRNVPTGLAPQH